MIADGALAYLQGFCGGIEPDPDLWVDEWADEFMRIPRGNGAEPGKYRTDRTPFAREVMRCLSPTHPCKRVVAQVASQLFKTQVGLNWLSAAIHQAPANMLVLLPTLGLAKRVSSRIGKTIDEIAPLRERVSAPRSRDSRNTLDTKEFVGGTLYITTAGAAANLAEIPARYVYGDEVDRWEVSVDQEGDPVELSETRTSTFGRNAKIYYTSSPTIEGASRIATLYAQSDQRRYFVPCPHCGQHQALEWRGLWWAADFSAVAYVCAACRASIDEAAKPAMLERGQWRAQASGDGETVGFQLSALYAPLGWVSWLQLVKQYVKAKLADDRGDPEPMQVFYNTRLALCWDSAKERTEPEALKSRGESYQLRTPPAEVLVLTCAVDVQGDRLEYMIEGWGANLERWVVDYQPIHGDPATDDVWDKLDAVLQNPLQRVDGAMLKIRATAIDSGGHHTHEVYDFTRRRRLQMVFAVKGASKPGRMVLSAQPSRVDINRRGKLEKAGAELWIVGTDTAKDWLASRWKLGAGPGAIHFSQDLPDDFFAQLCSERRMIRFVKGHKRSEWVKARGDRNEALDLAVYNLAAAQRLGLHKWRDPDWDRERQRLIQAIPPQPTEAQRARGEGPSVTVTDEKARSPVHRLPS